MSKNKDTERKNFSIDVINDVFREQGYCCGKCGKSLMYGFEAHHKDGDCSNDAKENCVLLCGGCHDAELWKTIQDKKKAIISQIDVLIEKASRGELAGALFDKALDAIKLKLSLEAQVSNIGLLEPPAEVKLESYQMVMEHGLRKYEEGVKDGLLKGLDLGSIMNAKEKSKK